jgi:hypothetical protein
VNDQFLPSPCRLPVNIHCESRDGDDRLRQTGPVGFRSRPKLRVAKGEVWMDLEPRGLKSQATLTEYFLDHIRQIGKILRCKVVILKVFQSYLILESSLVTRLI